MNRGRNYNSEDGLTLIELLLTVSLLGALTALILPNLISTIKSTELNSATNATAAWIDDLRRQAIQNSVPCQAAWEFAQARIVGTCENQGESSNFDINSSSNRNVVISNDGGASIWIFTPRGTTTTPGQVIFRLEGYLEEPGQCINLTAPLGLIRTGERSTTGSCNFTKGL